MNISGSGCVPSGDYNEKISVSGSARIDGKVRCVGFSCSGSAKGSGSLECTEKVSVAGSFSLDGGALASELAVSGSCRFGENCEADEIKVAGKLSVGGDIKSLSLKCAGMLSSGGGIEAESVHVSGGIDCAGLLNAEKIEIELDRLACRIGSIGGSDIRIYLGKNAAKKSKKRMPLFSKLVGNDGAMEVEESIEGDVIAIENVKSPAVVGRIVAIGAGCKIDLVQYSEEIEIDPDAEVARQEKI